MVHFDVSMVTGLTTSAIAGTPVKHCNSEYFDRNSGEDGNPMLIDRIFPFTAPLMTHSRSTGVVMSILLFSNLPCPTTRSDTSITLSGVWVGEGSL